MRRRGGAIPFSALSSRVSTPMFAAWRASYKTDALTPPRARLAGGFPAKAGAPDVDTGAGAVVVVPRAPEPNLTLANSLSSALAMGFPSRSPSPAVGLAEFCCFSPNRD